MLSSLDGSIPISHGSGFGPGNPREMVPTEEAANFDPEDHDFMTTPVRKLNSDGSVDETYRTVKGLKTAGYELHMRVGGMGKITRASGGQVVSPVRMAGQIKALVCGGHIEFGEMDFFYREVGVV